MARTSVSRTSRVPLSVETLETKEAPGSLSLGLLSQGSERAGPRPALAAVPSEWRRMLLAPESGVSLEDVLPAWRAELPALERGVAGYRIAPARTVSPHRASPEAFAEPADPFATPLDLLFALDQTDGPTLDAVGQLEWTAVAAEAGHDHGARLLHVGAPASEGAALPLVRESGFGANDADAVPPLVPLVLTVGVVVAACEAARAEACADAPASTRSEQTTNGSQADTRAADSSAAATTATEQTSQSAYTSGAGQGSPTAGATSEQGPRKPEEQPARDGQSPSARGSESPSSQFVVAAATTGQAGMWTAESSPVPLAGGAAFVASAAEPVQSESAPWTCIVSPRESELRVPTLPAAANPATTETPAQPAPVLHSSHGRAGATPVVARAATALLPERRVAATRLGEAATSSAARRHVAARPMAAPVWDVRALAAATEKKARGPQRFTQWAGAEQVTLALVFTDLVDSTALGCELGNEAMDEVRRAHFRRGRQLLEEYDGFEIKTLGDAFMVAFRTAGRALDFARALGVDPGHPFLRLRAGVHVGPVRIEEQDAHGTMVNYTARIVAAAGAGQVWLSDRAHQEIDEVYSPAHRNLEWTEHPECFLKGFVGGQRLWSVEVTD